MSVTMASSTASSTASPTASSIASSTAASTAAPTAAPTASPIARVLGTYELLEQILLNLPMKKIFVVQRVSSPWKDLIERSEPIRKKMFLLAEGPAVQPVDRQHLMMKYESGSIRLNPALDTICGDYGPTSHIANARLGSATITRASYNELQSIVDLRLRPMDIMQGMPTSGRMLLTQPPISALCERTIHCTVEDPVRPRLISRETGITLADWTQIKCEDVDEHLRDCEECRSGAHTARSWLFSIVSDKGGSRDEIGHDDAQLGAMCRACRFHERSKVE